MKADTLTTGAVAKLAGVHPRTLRDAVRSGLVSAPKRRKGHGNAGRHQDIWTRAQANSAIEWARPRRDTITTGQLAKTLGIGVQTVHDAIKRGVVTPSFPSDGKGRSARWTASDVETLRLAIATRKAMLALVGPVQRAAGKLVGVRSKLLLAVGPRGHMLVKSDTPGDRVARRVGFPFVTISRT